MMEILDVKSREGDCEAETSLLDKRAHTSSKKNRELKNFKGAKEQTLANFVEQYPEMKSYLQLLNELMQFTFRCEVKWRVLKGSSGLRCFHVTSVVHFWRCAVEGQVWRVLRGSSGLRCFRF